MPGLIQIFQSMLQFQTMDDQFGAVRSLSYPIKTDQYPRIGHRIIQVNNQILIFGGVSHTGEYNSTIIKVDCETMLFDDVKHENNLCLQGFSIFLWENRIYFWGGSGPSKKNPKLSTCQNQLQCFADKQFIKCDQRGRIPSRRENHASCVVPNKGLIIMGGNNGRLFFNDWFMLEFKTMTWFQLDLNQDLPTFMDNLLFWKAGRGFILTGEQYGAEENTLLNENLLYEFKFSDYKAKKISVTPISVAYDCRQKYPRGSPVACLANLQSPYIILLGGTKWEQGKQMVVRNYVECFNLETLEWFSLNVSQLAGLGFEALCTGQKLYMVGGLNRNKQLFQIVQYIEFRTNYLESKVCRSCRQLYGLKHSSLQNTTTSIKYETINSPQTSLSSEIVGKFSSYMNYPFSAFGLLIDNSFNLSGSNIDINFGTLDRMEPEVKDRQRLSYDFIQIIDNSMGFTSHQILDSLCSFSIKTQKLTSDKRYQQEIEIRKEYGVNLKLGSLRLGKSCLFMTKIEDKEDRSRLFAYYSTTSAYASSPFSVSYYILSQSGHCSSDVARYLIQKDVQGKIPDDYQTKSAMTMIYIFDFDRGDLQLKGSYKDEVHYSYAPSKIFRHLDEYFQSLYLKPYNGRSLRLNGREIKFRDYLQIIKRDEVNKKVIQLSESDYEMEQGKQQYFNRFHLFRITDKDYFLRDILFYHKNRLLFTMRSVDDQFCGIVQFNDKVKIDLCKTKLENRAEELAIFNKIRTIMNRNKHKRFMQFTMKSDMKSSPLVKRMSNTGNV